MNNLFLYISTKTYRTYNLVALFLPVHVSFACIYYIPYLCYIHYTETGLPPQHYKYDDYCFSSSTNKLK